MKYIFAIFMALMIVGCEKSAESLADSTNIDAKIFEFASLKEQADEGAGELENSIKAMSKFYLLEGEISDYRAQIYLTLMMTKRLENTDLGAESGAQSSMPNAESGAEINTESSAEFGAQKSPIKISGKIILLDSASVDSAKNGAESKQIFSISGEAHLGAKAQNLPLVLEHINGEKQILEVNIYENGAISGKIRDKGFFKIGAEAQFQKAQNLPNEVSLLNESIAQKLTGKDFDGSAREFSRNISIQTPRIAGQGEAIAKINETLKNSANFAEQGDDGSYNFEGISDFEVEYIDEKVIVFNHYIYVYSGGAHGTYSNDGVAFSLASGEQLSNEASALLKDAGDVRLLSLVNARLDDEYGDSIEGEVALSKFRITSSGIELYWGIYEIAPYAVGIVRINFTFAELAEFVKADSAYAYLFNL